MNSYKSLFYLVRLVRLERTTCGLEVRCSIQLSYRRMGLSWVRVTRITDLRSDDYPASNIPEIILPAISECSPSR